MKKQTILYAVACDRPAKGESLEEAQKLLVAISYDRYYGLPVVRSKADVDPNSLIKELEQRFGLDFYAPRNVFKVEGLCDEHRTVWAIVGTCVQVPRNVRPLSGPKPKNATQYFMTRALDPVLEDPTRDNDGRWAPEDFKLLHNLPVDIVEAVKVQPVPGRCRIWPTPFTVKPAVAAEDQPIVVVEGAKKTQEVIAFPAEVVQSMRDDDAAFVADQTIVPALVAEALLAEKSDAATAATV